MIYAIAILVVIGLALLADSYMLGRSASSDGDFAFIIPFAGGVLALAIAAVLVLIKWLIS